MFTGGEARWALVAELAVGPALVVVAAEVFDDHARFGERPKLFLIEAARKNEPAAERFVTSRADGLESFFIKNLENVQGDERDVIFVSVTYGPPAPGVAVPQRFGPINGPSGHRRLNVLFTRAKRRLVIFASLTADDVRVAPGSSRGVRALKGYLAFAQTGRLAGQATVSGREPDSEFEIAVAAALRARGLDVVHQVGVAGYFIDLAGVIPRRRMLSCSA